MMFKTVKNMAIIAAMVVLATVCASCRTQQASGSASVSNEKYSWGTYSADFGTTMFNMDKAVRNTCARARLVKVLQDFRGNECVYKYRDVDSVEVTITLKEVKHVGLQIKIRIGKFGDKVSSQKLLLAIDDELRLLLSTPAAQ